MFRGKKKDFRRFLVTFPQNVSQPSDAVIFVYPLSHVDPKGSFVYIFLRIVTEIICHDFESVN